MNLMAGIMRTAKRIDVPKCGNTECSQTQWQRWKSRHDGIVVDDAWYCGENCARDVLLDRVEHAPRVRNEANARPHRLPLGLLMLSRGNVDQQQLTAALEMKSIESRLRIGECLSRIGAVDEKEITRALAAQRCLPVLLAHDAEVETSVPLRLQRVSNAIAFRSRGIADLIYIGFASDVDLPLVSAVETVLRAKVEPCIVPESIVENKHEQRGNPSSNEVVIDTCCSNAEIVNSICSYARQFEASQMRVGNTRYYFWTHLKGHRGEMNLLHRIVEERSSFRVPVR